MTASPASKSLSMLQLFQIFMGILAPERSFYWLAIIYGLGISLLSLATPISVQMLINTVANTALTAPLILLSSTLFVLMLISGLLNALRIHLMEMFSRRFYARMVAEISLRAIYAQDPFFTDTSRHALFNRYFDIIGVQKALPVLFIGGFAVVLQTGVGFILVSLYHPLFLVFNLVLIALIWIIWLIWGNRAIRTAIDLSHAKHATANWLESLGSSNGFFKSQKRIDFALDQTDAYTRSYIDNHRHHFKRHFAQTLAFLFLYALASAVLLGLGGWLVIQGQLTLGQLVAAELVLSVAFFGMSQLGYYLNYFYDLCAALEELSLFYDLPLEETKGKDPLAQEDHTLRFHQVKGEARGRTAYFNLEIPNAAAVMVGVDDQSTQRLFTNLLKRHEPPNGGVITLGGIDLIDFDVQGLRQDIFVLDRSSFVEMSIRDYLRISDDAHASTPLFEAIETVGLADTIAGLSQGLDTRIAATGWPLSITEAMQLKLAAALVAKPRILILSQLFDLLDEADLASAISVLKARSETTIIYFSNRRVDLGFDLFLHMGNSMQQLFNHFSVFYQQVYGMVPVNRQLPVLDASGHSPIIIDNELEG